MALLALRRQQVSWCATAYVRGSIKNNPVAIRSITYPDPILTQGRDTAQLNLQRIAARAQPVRTQTETIWFPHRCKPLLLPPSPTSHLIDSSGVCCICGVALETTGPSSLRLKLGNRCIACCGTITVYGLHVLANAISKVRSLVGVCNIGVLSSGWWW